MIYILATSLPPTSCLYFVAMTTSINSKLNLLTEEWLHTRLKENVRLTSLSRHKAELPFNKVQLSVVSVGSASPVSGAPVRASYHCSVCVTTWGDSYVCVVWYVLSLCVYNCMCSGCWFCVCVCMVRVCVRLRVSSWCVGWKTFPRC